VESGVVAQVKKEVPEFSVSTQGSTWLCRLPPSQRRLLDDPQRDVSVAVLSDEARPRRLEPGPDSDRDRQAYQLKPGWYRVRLVVEKSMKPLFSFLLEQSEQKERGGGR